MVYVFLYSFVASCIVGTIVSQALGAPVDSFKESVIFFITSVILTAIAWIWDYFFNHK